MANQMYAQKKITKVVCFKSSMDCAGCENTITEYVKFEKGVKEIKADYVTNTVKIVYLQEKNTDENLAGSIRKKGYKAEKITEEEYLKLIGATEKK
jgi:copper chaperone CopZ